MQNDARLGHARGLACAKTKKFPCIFLAPPPPPLRREAEKEMERKFLVCVAETKSILSPNIGNLDIASADK